METFLDSSALFAWADTQSDEGARIAEFVRQSRYPLITTNLIFAETLSLVTKRLGKAVAIKMGELLYTSALLQIIHADEELMNEAFTLFKKYKDKDFDLIDAVSFVICRRRKIKEVLTLDRHFTQMGFSVIPT